MNNRPNEFNAQSNQSSTSGMKCYLIHYNKKTDHTKGHSVIEIYDQDNQPVKMKTPNGDEVHARMSFYPSSKPVVFFGMRIKENWLGHFLRVPVNGFSTPTAKMDHKIEGKVPDEIYLIENVDSSIVQKLEEQHEKNLSGDNQFLLDHKTGIVAYMTKAITAGKKEERNFKEENGFDMPLDLAAAGGALEYHMPEEHEFPVNHNCASTIDDLLYKVGVFNERQIFPSMYPDDLRKKVIKHGAVGITDPNDLPSVMLADIHDALARESEKEANLLYRGLENLESDPDDGQWLKDVASPSHATKKNTWGFFPSVADASKAVVADRVETRPSPKNRHGSSAETE